MNGDTNYQLRCTYRLQLTPSFGFAEAAQIADYLEQLGASHVYCSPYLQAATGSQHGYDVLDHQSVNAELGGTLGHDAFCRTLGEHRLGQVLDVVPNHMSIAESGNRWWWDVLENGPSSRHAAYFDVDWAHSEAKLHNIVLMPILGDHYGRVLEEGQIRIEREGGTFQVRYFDHVLPCAPRSLDGILSAAAERAESDFLAFAADLAGNLPSAIQIDRASVNRRHRDKEVLRRLLERELRDQPELAAAVDEVLAEINASPDELDVLLSRQNYRLAHWRAAKQDLGYRRFFDVNTLVGMRMEDERVFADTHALVLHWLERGVLDGLRIDHPDGLRDPLQYFQRLAAASSRAWILAEKILMPDENIPDSWPIAGTTGYDYLNRLQGIFVDRRNEEAFTEFYAEFTGEPTDYETLQRDKKHLVLRDLFASDITRLTAQLADICESHRRYRDYTRRELNSMLREVIACMSVYRTYIQADHEQVSDMDRQIVNAAIDGAIAHREDLDADLFNFLRRILLLEIRGPLEAEMVMRFQQCTGPVMAKGIEDTLFYCYNRFVMLNEVGGEPDHFGLDVDEYHRRCVETQQQHPFTMLATATHDTKRGEDVRMRLAVLSEIPDRWAAMVRYWSAKNDERRTQFMPDRNAEYLYYQTLVGTWPIGPDRIIPYMEKATRESKQHTSWIAVNEEYESALKSFIERTLADEEFVASVSEFVQEVVGPGRINTLSQVLLKLTAPGVPDIYQGTELWDLSLVDPDNRRPVDYQHRRKLLAMLEGMSPEAILEQMDEGLPKLWVIRQTLRLRAKQPDAFTRGTYNPIQATGAKAVHAVACMRNNNIAAIATRLPLTLNGQWEDTSVELPAKRWKNLLTGETVEGGKLQLAALLRRFPVALLAS